MLCYVHMHIRVEAANFGWGGRAKQDKLYMFVRNLRACTAQWPEQLHVRARKDLRNVHVHAHIVKCILHRLALMQPSMLELPYVGE